MTTVPEVPAGVRPVTGEHLSRVALSRPEREWRRVANGVAVAACRVRPGTVALPPPASYPKLFVVGCPRSGTSWVQQILSAHPAVVTSQESHAYENVYEPLVRFGHRSTVAWAKIVHRHDVSEREQRWVGLHWWVNRATLLRFARWSMGARDVTDEDAAERVVQAIFDSYHAARAHDPGATLLEKTPGHLAYAARILRRFPEARVVEVLRDGRDVCVSLQMQALTLDWPPTDRRRQIDLWVQAVERGNALHADPAIAGRVHRARYEDLKGSPRDEIARLYEFAGLAADDRLVDEVVDRSDFRHHRATGDGRHTRRGEVGDWRNHFDAADEALFREVAGATFEAAGYRF